MLIYYIRTPKKKRAVIDYKMSNYCGTRIIETGGEPIGVIVAIDRNRVGWSLCSPTINLIKNMEKWLHKGVQKLMERIHKRFLTMLLIV